MKSSPNISPVVFVAIGIPLVLAGFLGNMYLFAVGMVGFVVVICAALAFVSIDREAKHPEAKKWFLVTQMSGETGAVVYALLVFSDLIPNNYRSAVVASLLAVWTVWLWHKYHDKFPVIPSTGQEQPKD